MTQRAATKPAVKAADPARIANAILDAKHYLEMAQLALDNGDTENANGWLKTLREEVRQVIAGEEAEPCPDQRRCDEGGVCEFEPDIEYDDSGQTINCVKCGEPP